MHGGQEDVDVLTRGAQPATGAHGAGYAPAVPALHGGPGLGHSLGADAEQAKQVGVGTEAPVAHPDAPFRAQAGGHQGVVHALDGEGSQRQRVGPRAGAEHPHAVNGAQALMEPGRERRLVVHHGIPTESRQLVHGGAEGHRPDHVGGSGLLPIGRVGPDDLVQIDQIDRAAPGQEGVAGGEDAPGPDEGAGAIGGVKLVPAEGHEVRLGGQGPMRGQLRRIEQDGDPASVGLGADAGPPAVTTRSHWRLR